MNRTSDNPVLYHLLMGIGFLGLVAWFALMREVGFMTWLAAKGPSTHTGALNMLAIMLWMLPALLLWKYYVRWINRKLRVRGIYYEDHYYRSHAQSSGDTGKDEDQPATDAEKPPATDAPKRSPSDRP